MLYKTVTVYMVIENSRHYIYGKRMKAVLKHEQTKGCIEWIFAPQTFQPSEVVDARHLHPNGVVIKFFNGEEWEILDSSLEEVKKFFGLDRGNTGDRIKKLEKRRDSINLSLNKLNPKSNEKEVPSDRVARLEEKYEDIKTKFGKLEETVNDIQIRVGGIYRMHRS